VTLCLMFQRFLILCPMLSVSSLTNSCSTEWCVPLCKHVVVEVDMCGTKLFFSYNTSSIILWQSSLFVVIFIMSLFIIFKV
jgi:hypothetical protein